MNNFIQSINSCFLTSIFCGVTLVLVTFTFGQFLHKKTNFFLFSPLIISSAIIIAFITIFKIDYSVFEKSTTVLSYMLTPATVCLAVPLYEQLQTLKNNWKAILLGILSGVLANAFCIFGLCLIFKMGHTEYVSLLPKSITTAIGIALAEELHGIVPITIVMIVITGNLGNLFAPIMMKLFNIKEPVAQGIAIGTASHVMGTAKAMELGQVQGAMSSLSVAVTGLLTVIGASVFAMFI